MASIPFPDFEKLSERALIHIRTPEADAYLRSCYACRLQSLGQDRAGALPEGALEEQSTVIDEVLSNEVRDDFVETMVRWASERPFDLVLLCGDAGDDALYLTWVDLAMRLLSGRRFPDEFTRKSCAQDCISKLLTPCGRHALIRMLLATDRRQRHSASVGYLYRSIRNHRVSVTRAVSRRNEVQFAAGGTAWETGNYEADWLPKRSLSIEDRLILREQIRRGLKELTAWERTVLQLYFEQGMKPAEIAAELEMTPNAVSQRIHHAKQKIAQVWQELECLTRP